jgi:hypothetical protein
MTGKEKCNCLKQIRKTIADLNGIEYHPRECDEEVCNCGTCSLCDQEAEQLLAALRKKEASGSPIRIDVESIEGFGLLAVEPFEYDGEEPLAGVPLQGDIAPDDDKVTFGQIQTPFTLDDFKDK